MVPNRISAELSKEDQEEILAAIETIRKKLPFLITLSKKEMKKLPKASAKSKDFSLQSLEIGTQNQDILPRGFDIEEMRKDVELEKQYEPIYLALRQLMTEAESTHLLLRTEVFMASLLIYGQLKTLGKAMGLESSADLLGQLFARKIKSDPSDNQK